MLIFLVMGFAKNYSVLNKDINEEDQVFVLQKLFCASMLTSTQLETMLVGFSKGYSNTNFVFSSYIQCSGSSDNDQKAGSFLSSGILISWCLYHSLRSFIFSVLFRTSAVRLILKCPSHNRQMHIDNDTLIVR